MTKRTKVVSDIATRTARAAEPKPATTFSMARFDGDPLDTPTEEFELTAEQYEVLKQHLAELKKPAPSVAELAESAIRQRLASFEDVRAFLDLDANDLESINTILQIESRVFCGKNDPIAKFISRLVRRYRIDDERGEGLTVEDVESDLEELREDMRDSLAEAYFMADRYPRPEASNAE